MEVRVSTPSPDKFGATVIADSLRIPSEIFSTHYATCKLTYAGGGGYVCIISLNAIKMLQTNYSLPHADGKNQIKEYITVNLYSFHLSVRF
jgi:hypothetical protein